MAYARSVESRLLEGIAALFAADADIQGEFVTNGGGINVGPLTPNPTTNDAVVRPRQINLLIAPSYAFTPGVTGASDVFIPVIVAMYDMPDSLSYPTGSPNVTPFDRMVHLQKLLADGTALDGSGKIVNPDDPNNASPQVRYLNTATPEFHTVAMGNPIKDYVARLFAFTAIYETRQDNISRARA